MILLGAFAALGLVGCPAGGVGDPCTPEDEFRENFAGFDLTEANIESRSFQCQTRVCLVNHFQGRVSCPTGQQAPTGCSENANACGAGEVCSDGGVIITGVVTGVALAAMSLQFGQVLYAQLGLIIAFVVILKFRSRRIADSGKV